MLAIDTNDEWLVGRGYMSWASKPEHFPKVESAPVQAYPTEDQPQICLGALRRGALCRACLERAGDRGCVRDIEDPLRLLRVRVPPYSAAIDNE